MSTVRAMRPRGLAVIAFGSALLGAAAVLLVALAGDLAADLELADQAVHRWWPDAPGRVVEPPLIHGSHDRLQRLAQGRE